MFTLPTLPFTLPFTPRREKAVAIADVGSDSAGACIALIREGAPASIVCAERSSLSYDEKTPDQTITSVLSLLEDASTKVMRAYAKLPGTAEQPISSVHAVLHTPFIASQTLSAATSFEQDVLITHDMIGNLAKSMLADEKKLSGPKIFEAGVATVELNGYRTGKPAGKRAHGIAVTALISECEPELRAKITESLRKGFGMHDPVLHSDARALLLGMHGNPAHMRRHLIVDVSGDSTNCVVIHKDTAAEHVVVPEGVRTILKRIVGSGMPEETLSLMRMASRDACSTPACDQLNASLARAETELVKIFGEAFGKLISARRLPEDLVLIVAPDFAPWMSHVFSRIDFGQFTVTTRQFTVHAIGPEDVGPSVIQDLGPKTDAWLALGTALVESAEEQST